MNDLWFRVLPIVLGPVTAVAVTLWYQRRKEKRDAKHGLFVTLMRHRNNFSARECTDALNLIDVVYAEHPKVVGLWHSLYDQPLLLHTRAI